MHVLCWFPHSLLLVVVTHVTQPGLTPIVPDDVCEGFAFCVLSVVVCLPFVPLLFAVFASPC